MQTWLKAKGRCCVSTQGVERSALGREAAGCVALIGVAGECWALSAAVCVCPRFGDAESGRGAPTAPQWLEVRVGRVDTRTLIALVRAGRFTPPLGQHRDRESGTYAASPSGMDGSRAPPELSVDGAGAAAAGSWSGAGCPGAAAAGGCGVCCCCCCSSAGSMADGAWQCGWRDTERKARAGRGRARPRFHPLSALTPLAILLAGPRCAPLHCSQPARSANAAQDRLHRLVPSERSGRACSPWPARDNRAAFDPALSPPSASGLPLSLSATRPSVRAAACACTWRTLYSPLAQLCTPDASLTTHATLSLRERERCDQDATALLSLRRLPVSPRARASLRASWLLRFRLDSIPCSPSALPSSLPRWHQRPHPQVTVDAARARATLANSPPPLRS